MILLRNDSAARRNAGKPKWRKCTWGLVRQETAGSKHGWSMLLVLVGRIGGHLRTLALRYVQVSLGTGYVLVVLQTSGC